MATTILITDVTNGSIDLTDPNNPKWSGTGVFDKLIDAVTQNIKLQKELGLITGEDVAKVSIAGMESALAQSIAFVLQKQDTESKIELTKEQTLKTKYEVENILPAQKESINSQKQLYDRQKAGFNDNVRLKMYEYQLNSWGLMFSSGMLTTKPSIIDNDAVSTLHTQILNSLSV